ncbi:MAG: cytochrome c maturation protein CcmE [Nitrospinae bacterium]|nr:cytochrome c maturation protein CcmE [Nitrospinota bacterium]
MNKAKKKLLIGALVIVAAVSYLVYAGIQETSVYYLTVTQSSQMLASNKEFRMEGNVVPGSIKQAPDSLGAEFVITDSAKQAPIKYHGTIPDMFKDNIKVVVQGKYDKNGVFVAHTLLTSCPSKYEASKQNNKI